MVELWGAIVGDRRREALRVAVGNIPGVKAVKDHIIWVEPTTDMTIEAPQDAAQHRPA